MENLLNKQELINKIVEMDRGTVYLVNVLDSNNPVWVTFVTKTRWFDSHVVIIGGSDDELFVSKNFGCNDDNINETIEELIEDFIFKIFDNKYNQLQFTLSDKSELNIQSDTPSLRCGIADNFKYI